MNIILNYYLIYNIGILGAAVASLIAWSLFNVIKYIYVKRSFGIGINFSIQFIILLIGLVLTFILNSISFNFHPIINIVIKSLLLAMSYLAVLWIYNPQSTFRILIVGIIDGIIAPLKTK